MAAVVQVHHASWTPPARTPRGRCIQNPSRPVSSGQWTPIEANEKHQPVSEKVKRYSGTNLVIAALHQGLGDRPMASAGPKTFSPLNTKSMRVAAGLEPSGGEANAKQSSKSVVSSVSSASSLVPREQCAQMQRDGGWGRIGAG
ncbi:hypothetical protein V498_03371 [Pseudogymnoascus sp. VKM F-4517 (FW-2822)]|nr:hypothetical protein V498_03371 [Pseudogymnoascus sp. VKM F-4517 (FW-2822)]